MAKIEKRHGNGVIVTITTMIVFLAVIALLSVISLCVIAAYLQSILFHYYDLNLKALSYAMLQSIRDVIFVWLIEERNSNGYQSNIIQILAVGS